MPKYIIEVNSGHAINVLAPLAELLSRKDNCVVPGVHESASCVLNELFEIEMAGHNEEHRQELAKHAESIIRHLRETEDRVVPMATPPIIRWDRS